MTAPSRLVALAAALGAALALSMTSPAPTRAQFAPPPPDQADLTIDAATRRAVLDSLIAALHANYVFPQVARELDRELRRRQRTGEFESLTSARAFADTLSRLLLRHGRDRHFRVLYRHEPLPRATAAGPPSEDELRRQRRQAERINYGFERVERLAGNVGYLELRQFSGVTPEAGAAAAAAMNLLAHTDALIVDLRRNGGGAPEMVALLSSYLFEGEERVHLNDLVIREGGSERVDQYHTQAWVPGPRSGTRPVYVLTSRRTGSAAEEFANNLQSLERATLVGDTTAGAANPGGLVRLSDHFAAFISNGRARNPVSGSNWEGIGVRPDVPCAADSALVIAHVRALEGLKAKASDDEERRALERALEVARAAPVQPLGDLRARPR